MHFFLQVDANRPIRANHFIGTHAGGRWHISSGIRNANIRRVVANNVVSPFNSRGHKLFHESLL